MSHSLVSVIIPCFNSERTIERALASINNQTYKNIEIICIDDGSKDETVKKISEVKATAHHQITIIQNKENKGPSYSRNIGVNNAKGQYIAFLDSDDYWHSQKLELQLKLLQKYDLDFIGSIAQPNLNINFVISCKDIPYKRVSFNQLLFRNLFSTPTILMKKSKFIPFNEKQRYAEDYKLWLDIASNPNNKIALINLPLVGLDKFAYGVSGLSANLWEMEKNELVNLYSFLKKGNTLTLLAIPLSLAKFIIRLFKSKYLNRP